MTDNTYSYNEVLQMELKILKELKFNISLPTASAYIDRFLLVAGATISKHEKV